MRRSIKLTFYVGLERAHCIERRPLRSLRTHCFVNLQGHSDHTIPNSYAVTLLSAICNCVGGSSYSDSAFYGFISLPPRQKAGRKSQSGMGKNVYHTMNGTLY